MILIGRSSSHFTRTVRIFAHELGVPLELEVVREPLSMEPATFGGNPAMKVPTLRRADGSVLVGTENICRALADGSSLRIVWPEMLRTDLARNAQEFVWHAMAAQVTFVMGTVAAKLPAENVFFAKARAGLGNAVSWLDAHVDSVVPSLPARELSLFEVTLFCLAEHLPFRGTMTLDSFPALRRFVAEFGKRASAVATPYRFD